MFSGCVALFIVHNNTQQMKPTYTKEKFLEDVAKEARLLKKEATKPELKKLDFTSLDPSSKYFCVYGQMTGNCKSDRAATLIQSCCKRFIKNDDNIGGGMRYVNKYANGRKLKTSVMEDRKFTIKHFSSIETYILQPWAKNRNLLAYLKDETKTLTL
jgi:hypothetical protein